MEVDRRLEDFRARLELVIRHGRPGVRAFFSIWNLWITPEVPRLFPAINPGIISVGHEAGASRVGGDPQIASGDPPRLRKAAHSPTHNSYPRECP